MDGTQLERDPNMLQLALFNSSLQGGAASSQLTYNCKFLKQELTLEQVLHLLDILDIPRPAGYQPVEILCALIASKRPDIMESETRKWLWPLVRAIAFLSTGGSLMYESIGSRNVPRFMVGAGAALAAHDSSMDLALHARNILNKKFFRKQQSRQDLIDYLGSDPRGDTSLRKELLDHSRDAFDYTRKNIANRIHKKGQLMHRKLY